MTYVTLKCTFIIGDDGLTENTENVNLVKESENIFTLWCSGRTCCEGMLVELKLIKVTFTEPLLVTLRINLLASRFSGCDRWYDETHTGSNPH